MADIVQHVGGRALQIVAPLVVGTRVAAGAVVGCIPSLTDGRRGLGHDALCMLHHVHLPLEIAHSRFQLTAAGVHVHVHVLGASQRSLLAGRGGGTAAGMIATAALQIHHGLLREVIAYGTSCCCLIAATPNAAIAAALRCAACAAAYAAAVVALAAAAGVARLRAARCAAAGGGGGRVATAATTAATALRAAIDTIVQGAMHIQLKITRTAAHFRKGSLCSLVSL